VSFRRLPRAAGQLTEAASALLGIRLPWPVGGEPRGGVRGPAAHEQLGDFAHLVAERCWCKVWLGEELTAIRNNPHHPHMMIRISLSCG
jgi:hypothetical protein